MNFHSKEMLGDRVNVLDESPSSDEHTSNSLSLLEMSIGARAALTEHAKLVARYGLDNDKASPQQVELSWSSWQQNGSLSVDVSSDYFESSRVLLLASPTSDTKTTQTKQRDSSPLWEAMKRAEEDKEENSNSFDIDVSRISVFDDYPRQPFKPDDVSSSISFKPSPSSSLHSHKTSFSSTPSKKSVQAIGNSVEYFMSPIAAIAGHAAERVPEDFLGEADPFPESNISDFALDVSAIESDAHQHSFEQLKFDTGSSELAASQKADHIPTCQTLNRTHPMTAKDVKLLVSKRSHYTTENPAEGRHHRRYTMGPVNRTSTMEID